MLTVYPDYYRDFRCLAGACRHTCCAGWEVDIDAETLQTYHALPGELGKRLASAVAEDGGAPHFRLEPDERCPFLNDQNLCELILSGGEALLCQICRDHPRFRNFLPGHTEIGLGLCCEAAAELILTRAEPLRLTVSGDAEPTDEDAAALLALRDVVMSTAQDRTLPLDTRMERILALCGARLPERSWADWAAFYQNLERLDEGWSGALRLLAQYGDAADTARFLRHMTEHGTELEPLLSYFLYRHFLKAYDDGDVTSKAAFAVLSVRLLTTLGAIRLTLQGSFSTADWIELARMYSAEIEYSEENMDALFDELVCGDGMA